ERPEEDLRSLTLPARQSLVVEADRNSWARYSRVGRMPFALTDFWQPHELWTLHPIVAAIALLVVLAGHAALNVYGLNTFLGWPWPRWFSRIVRKANTFWVFAAPPLVLLTFWLGLDDVPSWLAWPWLAYIVLCGLTGIVLAPLLHLWYGWTHRRPAALASNHSDIR